ncbi:putative glycosyl hydrolases family 18 protein 2 [Elsinoe fawcettii]|nr:putative glycosyl hydrolases family 18 protein 2 [Elsinoe fawcettii]
MLISLASLVVLASSASGAALYPRQSNDTSSTCTTYKVVSGDSCGAISSRSNVTVAQLELYNKDTWAWSGCSGLQAGANMCISSGLPPMPASQAGTACGPLMPGSVLKPGQKLADLNPCPLNACCSAFGYCGTGPDHCTLPPPGTGVGVSGCVSNCGTNVTNNATPPATFRKIAYFQGDNAKRPCLRSDVTSISQVRYNHIHYSFALLTTTFEVNITAITAQFEKFKAMKKHKRILTFGGWSFSTEPATYQIFRDMVKSANAEKAATNIADFIIKHNLDGVDIDWEYPGAPDMPGIPPADKGEGELYLAFLKLLKAKLGNRSVSVAMPAGYWYLSNYPVKAISEVVDYIVFMTYDYHGLFDFGSKWSQINCDNGDCLRSMINITETMESLALVTKAGAKSDKVVVGVTSYARGYHAIDPSCTGPDCKWTLNATQPIGQCTQERGVMTDAELEWEYQIAKNNGTKTRRLYDAKSDTKIVMIGNWWLGFMDNEIKNRRTETYKGLNFGGTTDWAVDYQSDDLPRVNGTQGGNGTTAGSGSGGSGTSSGSGSSSGTGSGSGSSSGSGTAPGSGSGTVSGSGSASGSTINGGQGQGTTSQGGSTGTGTSAGQDADDNDDSTDSSSADDAKTGTNNNSAGGGGGLSTGPKKEVTNGGTTSGSGASSGSSGTKQNGSSGSGAAAGDDTEITVDKDHKKKVYKCVEV